MPKTPKKPDHISQEDWDAVDSPELSDAFVARMRPVREVAPKLIDLQRRMETMRGGDKITDSNRREMTKKAD